jgi:hypothetical protein
MVALQGNLSSSSWNMVDSQGNLSSFFPGHMTIPQGEKKLICSPRQLKLLFHRDIIVPQGKANFLKEQ